MTRTQTATRRLWQQQKDLVGDRLPLFTSVADTVSATSVLYPGSYVDLTPSFVWPSVTYVDLDRRARRFFDDSDSVRQLLAEHGVDPGHGTFRFLHGDYREPLDIEDGSMDLMISLYAGFISEHCTRYLREGGSLLVNSSHGDAAMASIDDRYRLTAVVITRGGRYRLSSENLDTYLQPKRQIDVTRENLHRTGRGIAYTKSPFAYLFERVRHGGEAVGGAQ